MRVNRRTIRGLQLGLLVVSLVLAVSLFFYFGRRFSGESSPTTTTPHPPVETVAETASHSEFLAGIEALEQALRERGFAGI